LDKPTLDTPGIDSWEAQTDIDNSRVFAANAVGDLKYACDLKQWLYRDETVGAWRIDDARRVEEYAKRLIESSLAKAIADRDRDKEKHFTRSGAAPRVRSMVELACSDPHVATNTNRFDLNPRELNTRGRIVNLDTGSARLRTPADLVMRVTRPGFYGLDDAEHPDWPEAPRWKEFLNRIMGGDAELVRFLQRCVGYSLTGSTGEQVMFVCHGTGANGKSVFLNTLKEILGDYALAIQSSTIASKRYGRDSGAASPELARLRGTRFVTSIETAEGMRLDEERIKRITGGDPIVARNLYQAEIEFTPTFKLWLAVNHRPRIRGTDEAIWRRIVLVPFTEFIPEEDRNPNLTQELVDEEGAAILAWAVQGAVDWSSEGLGKRPEKVEAATRSYREDEDAVRRFLADECIIESNAVETAGVLYASYCAWCEEEGEQPMSKKSFGRKLDERDLKPDKDRKGARVRKGLRLTEAAKAALKAKAEEAKAKPAQGEQQQQAQQQGTTPDAQDAMGDAENELPF
jgi:putative DNA primase/helicase